MGYKYAVCGAGRQGMAAAYDLAKFGDAEEILLIDVDLERLRESTDLLNELIQGDMVKFTQLDVSDPTELSPVLKGVDSLISAVPFHLNASLTETAIRSKTNMCDLGGNTEIVQKQLARHKEAAEAGITVIPDCGMGPGMNISLAIYAMSILDNPQEVYIWDGGLPQNPKPPWNYALTFNVAGLTNEYHGNAHFLRDGKIVEVPSLTELEEIIFPPPLNRLEAFVTSGGLSTMPWTFQGKLNRLENKTLRYPGHCVQFKAFSELGFLELEPVNVGDDNIVPLDVFHALLEPRITQSEVRDIGIIRVLCRGRKNGNEAEVTLELIDYYDETTGFSAMQRLTGWHASIIAILSAKNKLPKGAVPIEKVPGKIVVEEAKKRGFSIKENIVKK
jgi:lysine 6-dehydrogenase